MMSRFYQNAASGGLQFCPLLQRHHNHGAGVCHEGEVFISYISRKNMQSLSFYEYKPRLGTNPSLSLLDVAQLDLCEDEGKGLVEGGLATFPCVAQYVLFPPHITNSSRDR